MTYCAGWKYADAVYLLGDTAATKRVPPVTTLSSFGELHAEVRGEFVEECLLKVVPIGPNAAVAFAGDVSVAQAAIQFVKENYRSAMEVDELFSSLARSLGPFDSINSIELILACSDAEGGSRLAKWDSVRGLDVSNSDYYQIGSLTSFHAALTPQILSSMMNGKLASERLLPMITAVVQSYGVHDNLIDLNVGGLIFGLVTQDGRITWQEDTNYILYGPNMSGNAYVSAFIRDDVLVVNSSLTNDTRLLAHSASTPFPDKWRAAWDAYVQTHLRSDRYRYWVFISRAAKVITVVRREDYQRQSRFVTLTETGSGQFSMGISPELMALLVQPLIDLKDGSLPLRLNFRND